ncbi:MAG: phytoene/squalene synthase family protein [Flavobacteriaceae bacterium]
MKALFDSSSIKCSKLVTRTYSTSFSLGIRLFSPKIRPAIYAIYGFVRYADEIVDSFHDYDQEVLLAEFIKEYKLALKRKISLNPIINSFQAVVHKFELYEYVDIFLERMQYDLEVSEYTSKEAYENYIYGSADVVGLMCLRVFVDNDREKFNSLQSSARYLGSAFQKVNFLRDIKQDLESLGRSYFPNVHQKRMTDEVKKEIIADIEEDFEKAYQGLVQLPIESRLGVYIAYKYYSNLLKKLKNTKSEKILSGRIHISNPMKMVILAKGYVRYMLNAI